LALARALSLRLVEARSLVETPSLSPEQQRALGDDLVEEVHAAIPDLLVGSGVTMLGLAAMVVFVVPLAHWLSEHSAPVVATTMMVVGAAVAAAGAWSDSVSR
jgi:hypothetical protein